MSGPKVNLVRLFGVVLAVVQIAFAQTCYYPNGNEAPDTEKPCSSAQGSACCPDKWQCLDNGLCYYPADKLWGRYSCTDKDWKSPGCASNMCTYGGQAGGGESITQCSSHSNDWCCNADATHVNCCKESPEPRPFFQLQDGKPYATIGGSTASSAPTLASITGLASGGSDSSSTSSTSSSTSSSRSSSSAASSSRSTSSSVLTSVSTRTTSGASGPTTITESSILTTAVSTSTTLASPTTSDPNKSDSNNSKIPVIVGCAVGIPLGLALAGILFWLFRKRSQQRKNGSYTSTPDPYNHSYDNGTPSATSEFAGGAGLGFTGGKKLQRQTNGKTTSEKVGSVGALGNMPPELESQSVGPDRPVSTIPGSAELDTGNGFADGAPVPHAPHLVGIGGGSLLGGRYYANSSNGQDTHPPYPTSPTTTSAFHPAPPRTAGADAESSPPVMSASWGSAPPGYSYQDGANTNSYNTNGTTAYVPYRPPPGHAAHAGPGLSHVPEAAELGTTPAELAQPSPPAAELAQPSPPAAATVNGGGARP